jgi:hypothetical protein
MGKSQFDAELKVSVTTAKGHPPKRILHVGGPLELDAPDQYAHPVKVQFVVIQTDEHVHDPEKAKRVRGIGEEVRGAERWSGTVRMGPLKVGPKKETRGVAIAFLERTKEFTIDTITWCDHVELVERKRPGKAKPA